MAQIQKGGISSQNARREQLFCFQGYFWFEIKAILMSEGFDQFCPLPRQRTLKYIHIPAVLFLALNKIAANLSRGIIRS